MYDGHYLISRFSNSSNILERAPKRKIFLMANRHSDKKIRIHFNKFFSIFQIYSGGFLEFQIIVKVRKWIFDRICGS